MSNYDIAVCMDEATHNRVLAALYAKPGLRTNLFSGNETAQEAGVEVTIGYEALEAPVVSLNPPSAKLVLGGHRGLVGQILRDAKLAAT